MFPFRSEIQVIRKPILTITLIVLNVMGFICTKYIWPDPESWILFTLIPLRIMQYFDFGALLSLFTSMFMHVGWVHLTGNMLFLWICGRNVEDKFGTRGFIIFYLLSGLVTSLAQIFSDPVSQVPIIGASGAIAAVMGAYMRLYPRAKIWFWFFYAPYLISAKWALGFWFILQFFDKSFTPGATSNVAVWAHIGGFIIGWLISKAFSRYETYYDMVGGLDI